MRRRAALVPGTEPLSIGHEPRRVKGNASDRCSVANSTGVSHVATLRKSIGCLDLMEVFTHTRARHYV